MTNVWEGDWHERLRMRVNALGYRSVTEFARAGKPKVMINYDAARTWFARKMDGQRNRKEAA